MRINETILIGNRSELHKKQIAPLVAGALIGAGGSLLSGLLGSKSTSNAADTQLQSVRETNEANLELAKQQNDWNIAQWNRENEYNTPAAQLQRYIDAGINPLYATGKMTGTGTTGLQSANLANQVAPDGTAAQLKASKYDKILDGLSKTAEIFEAKQRISESKATIAKANAETDNIHQMTRNARYMVESFMPSQVALYDKQRDMADAQYWEIMAGLPYIAREKMANINLMRGNNDFVNTQNWWLRQAPEQAAFERENAYNMNKYSSDNALKGTKYSADKAYNLGVYASNNSLKGAIFGANAAKSASIYGSNKAFEGSKYTADRAYDASKYGWDTQWNMNLPVYNGHVLDNAYFMTTGVRPGTANFITGETNYPAFKRWTHGVYNRDKEYKRK